MKRRTSGIPSFIAVPVAVAAAVLWARSYAAKDTVRFARGGTDVALVSAPGRLLVVRHPQPARQNRPPAWDAAPAEEPFTPGNLLHRPAYHAAPGGGSSTATVPYWLPVLLGLIPPTWWATDTRRRRRRRKRRLLADTCLACGHNLRGSPKKCPHCGAPTV